jgi:hypothetical protein
MGSCGGCIGIALAPKNTKIAIRGRGIVECGVGSLMIQSVGRPPIKKISSGVECFNPIGRRKASLKQQRLRDIVKSLKDAFDFTVLLRGVRARHAKGDTMSEEERAGLGVIKLTPVVSLDTLDGAAKLGGNKREKVSMSGKRV